MSEYEKSYTESYNECSQNSKGRIQNSQTPQPKLLFNGIAVFQSQEFVKSHSLGNFDTDDQNPTFLENAVQRSRHKRRTSDFQPVIPSRQDFRFPPKLREEFDIKLNQQKKSILVVYRSYLFKLIGRGHSSRR